VDQSDLRLRFEALMLPHMAAAYNLARWITRRDVDAEDLTQEAFIRALQAFEGFRGGNSRAWLLTIVRNTCYTFLQRNRPHEAREVEDVVHLLEDEGADPEALLLQQATAGMVRRVLEQMPLEQREVLILREQEELSYTQIAEVVGAPIGTVMSRLARARSMLRAAWNGEEGPTP
jgi:RNA polymerase sigma-70 factor (ECF subfamily)